MQAIEQMSRGLREWPKHCTSQCFEALATFRAFRRPLGAFLGESMDRLRDRTAAAPPEKRGLYGTRQIPNSHPEGSKVGAMKRASYSLPGRPRFASRNICAETSDSSALLCMNAAGAHVLDSALPPKTADS